MPIHPRTPVRHTADGNTLVEYGVILGLVGLLCFAGLKMMGQSSQGVLSQSNQGLQSEAAHNLVTLQFNGAPATNHPQTPLVKDATGMPTINLTNGSSSDSNATSAEGLKASAQKNMSTAQRMDQIASATKDPALQKIYSQLVYYTYYLSGAEAAFSGMNSYMPPDAAGLLGLNMVDVYNKANALKDVSTLRQQVAYWAAQIPASDGITGAMMSMLAQNVLNNASTYDPYIAKAGGDNASLASYQAAYGGDTMILGILPSLTTTDSYTEKVSYNALKSQVSTTLATNAASQSQPVQSTMEDATTMDQTTPTDVE
jgi:Flp pilus assembly pilin Flp